MYYNYNNELAWSFIVSIIFVLVNYALYEKFEKDCGWKTIIPIYGTYCQYKAIKKQKFLVCSIVILIVILICCLIINYFSVRNAVNYYLLENHYFSSSVLAEYGGQPYKAYIMQHFTRFTQSGIPTNVYGVYSYLYDKLTNCNSANVISSINQVKITLLVAYCTIIIVNIALNVIYNYGLCNAFGMEKVFILVLILCPIIGKIILMANNNYKVKDEYIIKKKEG